jgi:hypothetical protein
MAHALGIDLLSVSMYLAAYGQLPSGGDWTAVACLGRRSRLPRVWLHAPLDLVEMRRRRTWTIRL